MKTWFRKTDTKKFGWNKFPKNNMKTKRKGYFIDKEIRKKRRKEEKAKQHMLLKQGLLMIENDGTLVKNT